MRMSAPCSSPVSPAFDDEVSRARSGRIRGGVRRRVRSWVSASLTTPPDRRAQVMVGRCAGSSSSTAAATRVRDRGHGGGALSGRAQRQDERRQGEDERRERIALVHRERVHRDQEDDDRGDPREGRGQTRARMSCLPWPCSSAVRRSRAAASGPSRTWMSQRSNSPPRTTLMQFGRRTASMFANRACATERLSLQPTIVRGHTPARADDAAPAPGREPQPQPSRRGERAAACRYIRAVSATRSRPRRSESDAPARMPRHPRRA